ncbi:WxL domain-containing protein [Xylocopilactobacillus apis]|uniref:WxL domain-containing protein n=1 Tax=Xylocopilactobacillus apis TaxID=2932183 RepID=A0AAU9DJ80_9LACO|nr:WxL domain-containing protein [Xylocopilactobacillus apis]BDR55444.1 hypothetical protein KIMC2_00060 [Xylocopilactobacillus apis]
MKKKLVIFPLLIFSFFALLIVKAETVSAADKLVAFKNDAGRTVGYVNLSSEGILGTDTLATAFKKLGATSTGEMNVYGRKYTLVSADSLSTDPTSDIGIWFHGTTAGNTTTVDSFMNSNTASITGGAVYLEGKNPQIPEFPDLKLDPTNDNVDFASSGWTEITPANYKNDMVWNFTRNKRKYQITSNSSYDNYCGSDNLNSLKVKDLTDPNNIKFYTYDYDNGVSSTTVLSYFNDYGGNDNIILNTTNVKMYKKPSKYGNAIAVIRRFDYPTFSNFNTEIMDVNPDGTIQVYTSYTERLKTRLNPTFKYDTDTDLRIFDANDNRIGGPGDTVGIYKGPGNTVYVKGITQSNPSISVKANIHYIDVSGKKLPSSGSWSPSDGTELAGRTQLISATTTSINSNGYEIVPVSGFAIVGRSDTTAISADGKKFKFPADIVNKAVETEFRVYFGSKNQYAAPLNSYGNLYYAVHANDGTHQLDDLLFSNGDSSVITADPIPRLDTNMTYGMPLTEQVVSSGELEEENTKDYYIYVQENKPVTLRAVPDFDFGIHNIDFSKHTYNFKSSIPKAGSDVNKLNLDDSYDNNTPSSNVGVPIEKYLKVTDYNGVSTKARALVVTNPNENDTSNWRIEASLDTFKNVSGTYINQADIPYLKLKTSAEGIDDYGQNGMSTWQKSSAPILATDPIIYSYNRNNPSDPRNNPTIILNGKNGTSTAVGSWKLDFAMSDSASLYFPSSLIQSSGNKTNSYHSTLTWTVVNQTP